MNYIDYIILVPLAYGLYRGYRKGLIIELASLLAIILGAYGAINLSNYTSTYLSNYLEVEASYIHLISYGLTFILIVIFITLIGKALTILVKMVALGFINRTLGLFFGGFKVLLILSLFILFFDRFNKQFQFVKEEVLDTSVVYPSFLKYAKELGPDIFQELEKQKQKIKFSDDEFE